MDSEKPGKAETPASTKAARPAFELPQYVILGAAFAGQHSGQVVAVTPDLIARLESEKVSYREATARERSLAGIPA